MKILGIDPGTVVTGYGIVEKGESAGGGDRTVDSGLIHLCSGEIRTDPRVPLPERLLTISKGLMDVIKTHRPGGVSIETLFFAKNVKSAMALGHARGVALLSAASFGIEVFEYSPMMIKQAVVGYGGATKDQVLSMVKMLLNIEEVSGADAADALAAAICHIHHTGVLPGAGRPATRSRRHTSFRG